MSSWKAIGLEYIKKPFFWKFVKDTNVPHLYENYWHYYVGIKLIHVSVLVAFVHNACPMACLGVVHCVCHLSNTIGHVCVPFNWKQFNYHLKIVVHITLRKISLVYELMWLLHNHLYFCLLLGEDCKATTVAPIITTPMTPSPKPKNPPMNKWGVQENGTLCVYMEGKLEFIIDYMNKDNKSVTIAYSCLLYSVDTAKSIYNYISLPCHRL